MIAQQPFQLSRVGETKGNAAMTGNYFAHSRVNELHYVTQTANQTAVSACHNIQVRRSPFSHPPLRGTANIMAEGGKQYVALRTPTCHNFTSELFVTRPFTLFKTKRDGKREKNFEL